MQLLRILNPNLIVVFLACGFFALVPATHAQLKWDQVTLEFTPSPMVTEQIFEFQAMNPSSKPVTIVAAVANCECTRVEFSKEAIAPGARTVISGVFEFEARVGVQRKKISVWTDPMQGQPQELELVVKLPDFYRVKPEGLAWSTEQRKTIKWMELVFSHNDSIEVTGVRVEPDDAFEVMEWKPADQPGEFKIGVRPVGDSEPGTFGDLIVITNTVIPRFQEIRIPLVREIPPESMPSESDSGEGQTTPR